MRRLLAALVVAAMVPLAGIGPVAAAPDAPTLLAPGAKKVLNQPYFRWDKVPGATAYQLEVATDSRFLKVLKTETTDINRFIDTTTWPAGTYWWRVKATAPVETDYSKASQFTRRWLVPDADGEGTEVARPDNVTVEDVSADPGLQAARNRFRISWEPVADASRYVVRFISKDSPGRPFIDCTTPHTVLTPQMVIYSGQAGTATLPHGADLDQVVDEACVLTLDTPPPYIVRVRAVDETADGRPAIESLWSDEARGDQDPDPADLIVSMTGDLPPVVTGAAQQTAPRSGDTYVDTPVLEWDPAAATEGGPATGYELVLSRDRDFTTVLARIRTPNTRWVPVGRFPEDDVDTTYYWYAVPCWGDTFTDLSTYPCESSRAAINRPGRYGSFTKHSLTLNTRDAQMKPEPWLQFEWQPYSKAVRAANRAVGRSQDSVGGIQYYEVQWKPTGGAWHSTMTDLPVWLPESLPFGQQFQWRVRIVDGSDQTRPWSDLRTDRTPAASPDRPAALAATRVKPKRVRLTWNEPDAKYFPVASYAVFYSFDRKHWRYLDRVQGTSTKLKVGKKTKYWFMVTATSRGGESAPSQVYVPRA